MSIRSIRVNPCAARSKVSGSQDIVQRFVEFLRSQVQEKPPYTPVALGGLWKGIEVTDEDIAAIRREMWAGFEREA